MSSLRFVPLCALLACGGAGPADVPFTFTNTPAMEVSSADGALHVAIDTDVDYPPGRGVNAFRFHITDADGVGRDGLILSVTPWMPVMGHGSAVDPDVRALGGGAYLVSRVYFAMPGTWDLRTDAMGDEVAPRFEIP